MRALASSNPLRIVGAPTLGYVAVGVSAFALLAAGPRLLGPDVYSDLAVAWTVSTVFGYGIAVPGEQAVTRGVAASGLEQQTYAAVRWRLLVASLPLMFCWVLSSAGYDVLGVGDAWWWIASSVACVSWAMLVGPRGTLAGAGRFDALAGVLGVEALARLALVAFAWMWPTTAKPLLGLAVGLPLAAAAVSAALMRRHSARAGSSTGDSALTGPTSSIQRQPTTSSGSEQAALTAIALAMQVLLNSPPLWLAGRSSVAAATAGVFVSVSAYLRIPALFTGGSMAVVLSRTSAASAVGNDRVITRVLTSHLKGVGALTTALTIGLIVAAPVGLTVLYGPSLTVSTLALALIGAATVIFAMANVATQAMIAMNRAMRAAWTWVFAALCASLCLAVLSPTIVGASVAVLIGVVVGAIGVAWALMTGLRLSNLDAPEPK